MAKRDRFEIKDAQYARRLKSGLWPSDTCQDCKRGACCKRDWHHSGDVCAHCGLDEREDGKMKFRKNGKQGKKKKSSERVWSGTDPLTCTECGRKMPAGDKETLCEDCAEKLRGGYSKNPPRPIKSDLEKVLKALGLPPNADDLIDKNQEFIWESAKGASVDVYDRSASQEELEDEAVFKAEQDVTDSIYNAWKNAIESAIEYVAQETGLGIQLDWKNGTAGIFCNDWDKCARVIWKIIEGVGYSATGSTLKEELAINSCNTARQYVQKYWFVVRERADVYGGQSIKRVYEKALESEFRNL